jgi:tyrosyl-tRNA synthetase
MIDPLTGGIKFDEFAGRKKSQFDSEIAQKEVIDLNPEFCPVPSKLSLEERRRLIKEVGIEIDTEEELDKLLTENKFIYCYDGFEPSGRMHIAQGLMKATNVNKLVDAGCIFIFWVADWFALLNLKMWGDLDKIRTVGRYFIEVWKAVGMKMSNVKFLWCSDHINREASKYWMNVIDIAKTFTISRLIKCS